MNRIQAQPVIAVGLMSDVEQVTYELNGDFLSAGGSRFTAGLYSAIAPVDLTPIDPAASFIIRDLVIGIDFHWERKQDQEFRGSLCIRSDGKGRLIVLNRISVESYLESVISSEMSASSHLELLKAHSIISRSWLLAQIAPWKKAERRSPFQTHLVNGQKELIRWYDRENHSEFDVCADDHCQRYQGLTKATSAKVFDAVRGTAGTVLVHNEGLCDARFSKSCGGMTESFDAAWADEIVPYLQVFYDGESFPAGFSLPLNTEANAAGWIRHSPPAYCNPADPRVLERILPDFDQETHDFYRWQVNIGQEEMQELLLRKLGVDMGFIRAIQPIQRGYSGRIVRLRIEGERETLIIGKELEIRRALSASHLYSSAFVVDSNGSLTQFTLTGAGWGHGVGLCQIGAAMMAENGYSHLEILAHYYRGAQLFGLYV